eukprot:2438395-Alexandrium_andersonii.AAC.1
MKSQAVATCGCRPDGDNARPDGHPARRLRPRAKAAPRVERADAPPRSSRGQPCSLSSGCPAAIAGLRKLR